MTERVEVAQLLNDLAADEQSSALRAEVCRTIGKGLARLGDLLWVGGYLIGPDRVAGASPYDFGDDRVVGLATVAQIGGELATGAADLLASGNLYSAACLARQLVEVEYLASAFGENDEIAADWLRADREERRTFWSPKRLRERADGRFLSKDYWSHCDRGGHPSVEGMQLLPDHNTMPAAYLWADLASHLVGIWHGIKRATEQLTGLPNEHDPTMPDVDSAIEAWREGDGFSAALRDLDTIRRDDPRAFAP
jgi:hypothetical protein